MRGRAVRTGVLLPPAGGSARAAVLEATGRALLDEARRGYGEVLSLVRIAAGSVVPPHAELDRPWPPDAGRALVAARRAGWRDARARLAAVAGARVSQSHKESITNPRGALNLSELERRARAALDAAVDAFDHLEDSEWAAEAHALAHAIGELVAGLFGCYAQREGDSWFDVCRLSIMHLRLGTSVGFVAPRYCSVCGNDFSECEHRYGNFYSVVADRRPDLSCTICNHIDCAAHAPGTTFSVPAYLVVGEARLDEISFVARPRDPLARPREVQIPPEEIASLPANDDATAILCCERCTSPCTGFTSVEEALGLA